MKFSLLRRRHQRNGHRNHRWFRPQLPADRRHPVLRQRSNRPAGRNNFGRRHRRIQSHHHVRPRHRHRHAAKRKNRMPARQHLAIFFHGRHRASRRNRQIPAHQLDPDHVSGFQPRIVRRRCGRPARHHRHAPARQLLTELRHRVRINSGRDQRRLNRHQKFSSPGTGAGLRRKTRRQRNPRRIAQFVSVAGRCPRPRRRQNRRVVHAQHIFDRRHSANRFLGENAQLQRKRSGQFPVEIHRAAAHPGHHSAVLRFFPQQLHQNHVLLRPQRVFQYSDHHQIHFFDRVALKNRVHLALHSGFDVFQRKSSPGIVGLHRHAINNQERENHEGETSEAGQGHRTFIIPAALRGSKSARARIVRWPKKQFHPAETCPASSNSPATSPFPTVTPFWLRSPRAPAKSATIPLPPIASAPSNVCANSASRSTSPRISCASPVKVSMACKHPGALSTPEIPVPPSACFPACSPARISLQPSLAINLSSAAPCAASPNLCARWAPTFAPKTATAPPSKFTARNSKPSITPRRFPVPRLNRRFCLPASTPTASPLCANRSAPATIPKSPCAKWARTSKLPKAKSASTRVPNCSRASSSSRVICLARSFSSPPPWFCLIPPSCSTTSVSIPLAPRFSIS